MVDMTSHLQQVAKLHRRYTPIMAGINKFKK